MSWLARIFQWFTSQVPSAPTTPQSPPPAPSPAPGPAPVHDDQVVTELVTAINAARTSSGLVALFRDDRLQRAAQLHAGVMARARTMAHQGLGDGDVATRATAQGYHWYALWENAAEGQADAASVVREWMADEAHKAAVLSNTLNVGAGMDRDAAGVLYWCAVFGLPC